MKERIPQLAGHDVLIIGDLMLDHYLIGTVDRISPEAPVPVVAVTREESLLGGAGNVARNIAALGGLPTLITVAGEDEHAICLGGHCDQANINLRVHRIPTRPTTVKTRIIAHNQQVVRVDKEHTDPLDPADYDVLLKMIRDELPGRKVIILSDYGKGLLSREFMTRFNALIAALPQRPMILVDPKTRNYDLYGGVDLLTPNAKEASEGAHLPVNSREEIIAAGQAIFDRLSCKHLLITLGGQGMALFDTRDKVYHIPTFARKVFDVTGAGDTVIATLALGLASDLDLLTSCVFANYAAGIVVGQIGAAVATLDELVEAARNLPEPDISTWHN
ncbi:D-glycero-beta-D-manno-heptose-7-phosphate kinase [Paucidesulfovibrio longus]|uniref:D-glycero-beta-D-manno-heptose-7-phosphate kinase n=1 Tax=Paucidesulfovibrio longus TaxID=889 RepID=UPI0003B68CCA|nr:D-glycero-beta-D-manno-heptose-7-phosphate kinase [Paucidesulfovibrio longus]